MSRVSVVRIGHKQQSSAIAKHYKSFKRALKPNLNVQSDSIRAKYFYNLRTLLC